MLNPTCVRRFPHVRVDNLTAHPGPIAAAEQPLALSAIISK